MPEAILLMRLRSKRQSELSVGTEYRSREAPHIAWQIIAQYKGAGGLVYAVLRNLSDRTWQKTMSRNELEHGAHYSRMTEKLTRGG